MNDTTPTVLYIAARDLLTGDRTEDGGRSGRIVKHVNVTKVGVRITWIDGWDDTFAPDHIFQVRERGVVLS